MSDIMCCAWYSVIKFNIRQWANICFLCAAPIASEMASARGEFVLFSQIHSNEEFSKRGKLFNAKGDGLWLIWDFLEAFSIHHVRTNRQTKITNKHASAFQPENLFPVASNSRRKNILLFSNTKMNMAQMGISTFNSRKILIKSFEWKKKCWRKNCVIFFIWIWWNATPSIYSVVCWCCQRWVNDVKTKSGFICHDTRLYIHGMCRFLSELWRKSIGIH